MIAFLLPAKYLLCIYHANTNKTIHFAKFHFVPRNFGVVCVCLMVFSCWHCCLLLSLHLLLFLLHFDLIMRWNGIMMFRFHLWLCANLFDVEKEECKQQSCEQRGTFQSFRWHYLFKIAIQNCTLFIEIPNADIRYKYLPIKWSSAFATQPSSHDKQWRMINLLYSIK